MYTIDFTKNCECDGRMEDMTGVQYGKSYTLRKLTYKRTGYTFVGWNTKKDGSGTTYKNGSTVKNLTTKDGSTVKLYAIWKKK